MSCITGKADSILHPARESRETLERIKAEIGSLQFSAQYQQSPVPPKATSSGATGSRPMTPPPSRGPGVKIVQSWDIATTTDERNDWSVCTTWAIKQKDFYLLDVWRARVEFPALRRQIVNHALAHQAQIVLIEKAGPGLQLVQDLRNDPTPGFPRPMGIVPEGDKWMRMEAQTPRFEAGHVLLPKRRRGSPPSSTRCSPSRVDGTTTRSTASPSSSSGCGPTQGDRG